MTTIPTAPDTGRAKDPAMGHARRPTLVGGVFPDRMAAAEAAAALQREDLVDKPTIEAVWDGDRYVIESHVGRLLRAGTLAGTLLGGFLFALLGGTLAILVWEAAAWSTALVVGSVAGAAFGATLGGYVGLARFRPQLDIQRDWSHIAIESGDTLLVFTVTEDADRAVSILKEHGARAASVSDGS